MKDQRKVKDRKTYQVQVDALATATQLRSFEFIPAEEKTNANITTIKTFLPYLKDLKGLDHLGELFILFLVVESL